MNWGKTPFTRRFPFVILAGNWKNHRVPTTSLSRAHQARSLCEQGLWPEALAFAQQWQRDTLNEPKAFFYEGAALAALGRLVEAETAYSRALALDENDFKTWNNLAALLFDGLNQPAEGAKCLARALQIDPGNKLGWANLASMHGQLGRHGQALDCAERALALDPEMVEAQLHRARAAQALGKPEIVRAASEALSRLPLEKFKRAR
jgi:tetratricopeptide (TPR) repeat protein